MNRALELQDLIRAGVAVGAGLVLAFLARTLTRWLGRHAERTRWQGDDVIVGMLRTVAPWAAVLGGLATASALLPLTDAVDRTVGRSLTVVMITVVTLAVARGVGGMIGTITQARSGVASSASIFANITRVSVVALGFLVILQSLGISIAPLLTALGVGGLAVALALQDTLANLFAGIHILASKTVRTGDYIRLTSGEEGYVVDINWRQTTIRNLSQNLVIIPNGKLAGTNMTNFSRPGEDMTIMVQAGVGYDSDLEHVERVTAEVVAEVMKEVEGAVPEHEPAIRFHTFADSRIGFTAILGVGEFSDQYRIKHEFIKRLHRRFRAEGISVPPPIHDVTVRQQDPAMPHQRAAQAAQGLPG
ncbi:mechanosensitive ion channel family protein [Streptomyces sp. NPDC005012]|uniref:mechanosensitive ion channel family protein n=1 Tax=unclassified Streptomyces TaxID=2593676 RepID=UPI0033B85FEB